MSTTTNVYLKSNVMGLASQQRILRKLEQSRRKARRSTAVWAEHNHMALQTMHNYLALQQEERTLYNQRIRVRSVARAAGLAYGFIRGRSYRQMEEKSYSDPHWPTVIQFIRSFSKEDPRVWLQRFQGWLEEGTVRLPKCQEERIRAALGESLTPRPANAN